MNQGAFCRMKGDVKPLCRLSFRFFLYLAISAWLGKVVGCDMGRDLQAFLLAAGSWRQAASSSSSFHLDMNNVFHATLKPSVLPVMGANAGVTFSPSVTAECRPGERVCLRLTARLEGF